MQVMPTLRHADPETARHYPLAVNGAAPWQDRDGIQHLRLPLPPLGGGVILVPSLTLWTGPAAAHTGEAAAEGPDGAWRHQWTLRAGDDEWPLQEVPGRTATPPPRSRAVTSHIDCFHVHRPIRDGVLQLRLESDRIPERYLICVSARPLTMVDPPLPERGAALPRAPAPRSQMTAPEAIASRICSPTCVSMVLDLWQRPHDWLALTAECYDPVSHMYGVWPLALAAAARRGILGAVEVFGRWEAPLDVLDAGVPLITSIRFEEGGLPGAPLTDTAGHLVVVHAVTPDSVQVCDPAALDGEVPRTYPAAAFSGAWLRHRGAAYILPP